MRFSLNKKRLSELRGAIRRDPLRVRSRSVVQYAVDQLMAEVRAEADHVHVHTGRLTLSLPARVVTPGRFVMRNKLLRELMLTTIGEGGLDIQASDGRIVINGAEINIAAPEYVFGNAAEPGAA